MVGTFQLSELRLDRGPLVAATIAIASGSWDRPFQGSIDQCAEFVVARAMALVSPSIGASISFSRVRLADITETNPDRVAITARGGYPQLRQRLVDDPGYDSVPVSVGRSSRGITLWDGHRRMETYRAAGRIDIPAWMATFRRGGPGTISIAWPSWMEKARSS